MNDRPWPVEHLVGDADRFHRRDLPDPLAGRLWWFEVTVPTVVLGSTQDLAIIDADTARRAGVQVARRRSGGGAVYLAPDEVTWVDVLVPRSDGRWVDDVGQSAIWLGNLWVDVLDEFGIIGARVREEPMHRTRVADLVCFAGLAPGEVTVGAAKVIGISQRRTRVGARFQCAVLHRWDPAPLLDVLELSPSERTALAEPLADAGAGIGPVPGALLIDSLQRRLAAN